MAGQSQDSSSWQAGSTHFVFSSVLRESTRHGSSDLSDGMELALPLPTARPVRIDFVRAAPFAAL
jgi:hypothetical protein